MVNNKAKTISIVSSAGQLGKSLITRTTAYELEKLGYKVLIIDFDWVKPAMQSLFGQEVENRIKMHSIDETIKKNFGKYDPNSINWATGKINLKQARIDVSEKIHLIKSIPSTKKPDFKSNIPKLKKQLNEAKDEYDVIILDTTGGNNDDYVFESTVIADKIIIIAKYKNKMDKEIIKSTTNLVEGIKKHFFHSPELSILFNQTTDHESNFWKLPMEKHYKNNFNVNIKTIGNIPYLEKNSAIDDLIAKKINMSNIDFINRINHILIPEILGTEIIPNEKKGLRKFLQEIKENTFKIINLQNN